MSKTDIVLLETDFDEEAGGGFRLHQCGFLSDMRAWRHPGLRGPFWRVYHHVGAGSAIRLEGAGGRRVPLLPGEIVLIPENVSFDALGAPGTVHHWLHFSPPPAARPDSGARVIRLRVDPALDGLLREWRPLLRRPGERRRLLHASLAVLHACLARARLPEPEPGDDDGTLRAVLEEIERSLAAPPGHAALARRAGRSVEGFIRWFKERTGETPARYGTRRRTGEAGRLLTLTGRSIDEIAAAVGFANRHHFSRVFARHAGQSPARFRAAQRTG